MDYSKSINEKKQQINTLREIAEATNLINSLSNQTDMYSLETYIGKYVRERLPEVPWPPRPPKKPDKKNVKKPLKEAYEVERETPPKRVWYTILLTLVSVISILSVLIVIYGKMNLTFSLSHKRLCTGALIIVVLVIVALMVSSFLGKLDAPDNNIIDLIKYYASRSAKDKEYEEKKQEALNNYNTDMAKYKEEVESIEKEYLEESTRYETLKKRYETLKNQYEEAVTFRENEKIRLQEEAKETYEASDDYKALLQIKKTIEDKTGYLESTVDFLHPKYRNRADRLANLIEEGRASNVQEAINVMINDEHNRMMLDEKRRENDLLEQQIAEEEYRAEKRAREERERERERRNEEDRQRRIERNYQRRMEEERDRQHQEERERERQASRAGSAQCRHCKRQCSFVVMMNNNGTCASYIPR